MKYDEFAFFNQQLGTMLRDGIPLEGALRQLSANLQDGALRTELELLEADLKNGTPLPAALATRKLPEFYVQMVRVGVQGNDLPGMLLLLADYYRQADSVWTRLKGLMVYPLLLLAAAFGLSCFFTVLGLRVAGALSSDSDWGGIVRSPGIIVDLWVPPILIGLMLLGFLVILLVPAVNRRLRWRLPAFKEAKLSQVASALQLMLKNGGNLDDALGLAQQMEAGSPGGDELAEWKHRLAGGRGKFKDMTVSGRAFPPLFVWLVGNSGEDLAGGFQRAAEIYGARAANRIEMLLYAALPFSILALGAMIICQMLPMLRTFVGLMNFAGTTGIE
jgi:type II secretory pathway component PulF